MSGDDIFLFSSNDTKMMTFTSQLIELLLCFFYLFDKNELLNLIFSEFIRSYPLSFIIQQKHCVVRVQRESGHSGRHMLCLKKNQRSDRLTLPRYCDFLSAVISLEDFLLPPRLCYYK